jgi:Golgi SNAP receptor complex protein 2
MNAIHNHAVRQIASIRKDLTQFEQDVAGSPLSLQGTIAANITQLVKTLDDYESFMKNETDEKLERAQLKLSAFKRDLTDFKKKFQELKRMREEMNQEVNKSALLNRKPQTSENPYHQTYADGLYHEHESLARGNQQLDEILQMGREAFEELVHTNRILSRMSNTLTGSLTTLGVSQDTIRTIERRAREDKFVFWGCVVVFFVICYLMLRWLK